MGCNKDESIPIVFLYTIYLLFLYWSFNSSLRRNTIEFSLNIAPNCSFKSSGTVRVSFGKIKSVGFNKISIASH